MNKSMIDWCDVTLNMITGCNHGCPYCYARQMTKRFSGNVRQNISRSDEYEIRDGLYILDKPFMDDGKQVIYPFGFAPTLHRYRKDNLKSLGVSRKVFVGAMADMFGEWVPDDWIYEVFEACEAYPRHHYLFLTKNPARYKRILQPQGIKAWYGTTVTKQKELQRLWELPKDRNTFLSVEPILEPISFHEEDLKDLNWIIIGAQTGRAKGKVVPEREWIDAIVVGARAYGVPVFMKESLIPIVGEENMIREYPPELMTKELPPRLKNKLWDVCLVCGEKAPKNQMVTLSARVGKGVKGKKRQGKKICVMCRACYEKWCAQFGIESYVGALYGEGPK